MKLMKISVVLLLAAAVFAWVGADLYARDRDARDEDTYARRRDREDRDWGKRDARDDRGEKPKRVERIRKHIKDHPGHFPMLNSEEFKAERERHEKAVAKIMKKAKPLREKLRKEIKELREEYFSKPKKGERRRRPDRKKIKEFMEELKEVIDEFAEDNEKKLKRIASKMFDEKILHMENIIKISKDNKRKIINAHYKKILLPKPRMHNMKGKGMDKDKFKKMRDERFKKPDRDDKPVRPRRDRDDDR